MVSAGKDNRPAGVSRRLGFLNAGSKGPVTPVVALTGRYPALSIILGSISLQEPIALKQGIGILLARIAMYLIAT